MPHSGQCVFVGDNLCVHAMAENSDNQETQLAFKYVSQKGSRKILMLSKDLTVHNFIQY